MSFKKLFSNDKGVTPVVGVMLMVVVTVILAAAVSSYASSMKTQDAAPQAVLKSSASIADKYIKFEHLGGDVLSIGEMSIEITQGTTGGYANMLNVTAYPKEGFIRPGDTGSLSFTTSNAFNMATFAFDGPLQADFKGDEISMSVGQGTPFKITFIDKNSGQTIYTTTVTMNP